MRDLFLSVPKELRQPKLQEYEHYLIERDGELEIETCTLSKREALMKKHEARPAATAQMDPTEFRAHYVAFDKRKPISSEMLLLLSLVKINSAEAYGVARNFQRTMARAMQNGDHSELRILCEEGYHTRILLSSANHYGIEVKEPYVPPSALRILIGSIASAPATLTRPLVLAGELIATLMFTKLLAVIPRILGHAPEIRDAIEERVLEICTDEHGHISFNRLHATPADFAQLRLILPITARVMMTAFPEIVKLGVYPTNILQELPLLADPKRIPTAVRREAFLA
jgi:hypothetical protein